MDCDSASGQRAACGMELILRPHLGTGRPSKSAHTHTRRKWGQEPVLCFSFQLHFVFSIILYWFQVGSIVVRQSHTLQSGPRTSSARLAPSIAIQYHRLYPLRGTLRPRDRFITADLYVSIHQLFHPGPHTLCPLATTSPLSVSASASIWLVGLLCSLDST